MKTKIEIKKAIKKLQEAQAILNAARDNEKGLIKYDLDDYVGADIAAICREAVMIALREDLKIDKIRMDHFLKAKTVIHPSANAQITKEFETLEKKLLRKSEIARKDTFGIKGYL